MRATRTRLMKNSPRIQAFTSSTREATKATPGGEAVHVVEQVEGVGDADHPDDGEGDVEGVVVRGSRCGSRPPTRTEAARTWPASLKPTLKRLPSTSSRRPTTNAIVAAEEERQELPLDPVGLLQQGHRRREVGLDPRQAREDGARRSTRRGPPRVNAVKTAIPPMRGVGRRGGPCAGPGSSSTP